MNKKFFGMIAIAAFAVAAGWAYQQNESVQLSDVTLENIEVLADPEEGLASYNVIMDWCGGMGGFICKKCYNGGSSVC